MTLPKNPQDVQKFKQRMRELALARWKDPVKRVKQLQALHSPAAREKKRKKTRGRKRPPEVGAKISRTKKGKPGIPRSEKTRILIGISSRNRKYTKERNMRISQKQKGRKKNISPEGKQRQSEAKKGKNLPLSHCKNISISLRKHFEGHIYADKTYIPFVEWRKAVFERDVYTCQDCHVKGGMLNAHHIKLQSLFPSLRFDIRNGRTLCESCHKEIHRKIRLTQKLLMQLLQLNPTAQIFRMCVEKHNGFWFKNKLLRSLKD